jgi:ABC-type glycerol-3-phosphate transport system substrate-binding protein
MSIACRTAVSSPPHATRHGIGTGEDAGMTRSRLVSRRTALKMGAGAAALPLVHIRTAGAAGKLTVAFWDSFVPGATDVVRQVVKEWAEKTKVAVQADFMTVLANKMAVTMAAESQAKVGHDIIMPIDSDADRYADQLEPVDDLVDRLSTRYGALAPMIEHYGKVEGVWRAVPASYSSGYWPCETRIDLFKDVVGLDVQATFPVAPEMGSGYDQWTWDMFLIAAEKCFKAGHPFGLPMGQTPDSWRWVGALFHSFGAELVDAKKNISAKSENVHKVLDYAKRLMPFLPPDVYSWDNASNNRALISGRSALIFNPPSAWAAALQDNRPVGEQIWHHPLPAGEHGRFAPFNSSFWGIWNFSKNKTAATELIEWLSQREQVERLCVGSQGYDVPPFMSMTNFPIWEQAGPPKGTLYNYPLKPGHHAEPSMAGWPAPPKIMAQIQNQAVMPQMIARITHGGATIDQAIAWAESELEGFVR